MGDTVPLQNTSTLVKFAAFPQLWKRALLLIWAAAPGFTVVWAVLLLLQGIAPGVTVYLTKYVIDAVVAAKSSGGDWASVSYAIFLLIAIGSVLLISESLQYFSTWIRTAQAESISDHLTNLIHRQAAEVDLAFYESSDYHDLLERARGDSSSKPLALLESVGTIVQNTITLLAMAALLVAYGWWLPLVLLVGTLPALYVALRTDRRFHHWWKSTAGDRRWLMYYDAMLTHSDAATEMRLFNLSGHFRSLYQTTRTRLRSEKLRHIRAQSFGKVAAGLIALMTAAAAIGWMAVRVLYNLATLGDLAVFYQIFSRGQGLMGSLLGSVGNTVNHSLYLENLFTFLDLERRLRSPERPEPIFSSVTKGIAFRSVTFTYPGAKTPAIKDFDLYIPAGQVVALVGVNGAGKSTLIKLLCRFYDPTEGSIEIDGVDIRQFDIDELRQCMSVLFQFPVHYHAVVKDNIALGDVRRVAGETDIVTAARRAGADDFISKLPERYDTLLGKWFVNGAELSGGEWQRLALARAYFRQAPVVVLDEPTSFMDSWAEVDWFDRFREMVAERTGLVITHRFTIAMRADIIHVIHDGKIVESGTHKTLLSQKGFYAASWESQMNAAEIETVLGQPEDALFVETRSSPLEFKD